MKKVFVATLALMMCLGLRAQQPGDVVVLFDNDVHCAVEGYPYMAGLRDSLQQMGCAVAVVSSGDFSFGGPIGSATKGGYIVRMMNAVGYDAVALGNHEFDYGMQRLRELGGSLTASMLSCNLRRNASPEAFEFAPFVVRQYGGLSVGFVGVTTPTTLYTSQPTAFRGEDGQLLYDFGGSDLAASVQRSVDMARAAGAEVVVLLSHLGDSDGTPTSVEVLSRLKGVDVVLDAHDHHVIAGRRIADKEGNMVPLASTGTRFRYIGMAVLSGGVRTRLVPVDSLRRVGCCNAAVADTLKAIEQGFEALGSRRVGQTQHDLVAEEGDMRVVRLRETNLGDLVADAFRAGMNTDIGWVNGGGVRANVPAGEITRSQLLAVCPYANRIVAIRVTGQDLLDALETAVREYPRAEGCFAQVSGLTFDVDTSVSSGVKLGADGRFLRVEGAYRVHNVRIGQKPLEPEDTYTIAGSSYVLIDGGDAVQFPSKEVLGVAQETDVELLERYIEDKLGGIVAAPYDKPQGRINFR